MLLMKKIDHNKFCETCGKKLTNIQITKAKVRKYRARFCSRRCAGTNLESLKEPMTPQQQEEIDRVIQEGKISVMANLYPQIALQTPKNDSAEAEKKLREEICPNPVNWWTAGNGKYLNAPIKSPHTRPRGYKE